MYLCWLSSLLYCTDPGTSHSMSSLPLLMSVFVVACIPPQMLVKTYIGSFLYSGTTVVPFWSSVVACLWALELFSSLGLHLVMKLFLLKTGMLVHLKRNCSLLSFIFVCLNIKITFPNVSSRSLPCSSKPAIKISSAIPNTSCMLLNNSSVFFCNMCSVGAGLNGSLMYLYLPNGQENVVNYDDFSSRFWLW